MISIDKCKNTDVSCRVCFATNKTELSEIDKLLGARLVKNCYEVLIGNGNSNTQIILCKDCLKELNMLSGAIIERDKEEPKVIRKIINGSLLETYNINRKE